MVQTSAGPIVKDLSLLGLLNFKRLRETLREHKMKAVVDRGNYYHNKNLLKNISLFKDTYKKFMTPSVNRKPLKRRKSRLQVDSSNFDASVSRKSTQKTSKKSKTPRISKKKLKNMKRNFLLFQEIEKQRFEDTKLRKRRPSTTAKIIQ